MEMSIEQRNAFIEANTGIIGDIAKPYQGVAKAYGYEYTDLFNSGVVGMIEGIKKYDIETATTEKGVVPLEAFVRFGIKKHISNFIAKPRKHDRLENKVSMDQKVAGKAGENSGTVGDMIADKSHTEDYGVGIDHERIREILDSDILSDVEKIAVDARFMQGLKFREIDILVQDYLGNPKAKAFHYINTSLAKLKKALTV